MDYVMVSYPEGALIGYGKFVQDPPYFPPSVPEYRTEVSAEDPLPQLQDYLGTWKLRSRLDGGTGAGE